MGKWVFIAKKRRHATQGGDPDGTGDVCLLMALAATQKAVLSYAVGNARRKTRKLRATNVRRDG
jgi:hypothetical protein